MLTQGRGRRAVSHIQFSREIVETKGVLYCLVVSNPSVTLTLSCMCDLRGFYIIGSSYVHHTQSCILSLLLRIFGFVDGWPKLEKWFTKFGIFQRIDANTSQGTCNNKTVVSSVITPSLSLPPTPAPYPIPSSSCQFYRFYCLVYHNAMTSSFQQFTLASLIRLSTFVFFVCLEQLYDEVSGLLNETYQKLIAPPEEAPSVSNHLKSF